MTKALREDVDAIASGDLLGIERVLASTGKLVGTVDAAHADRAFIAWLLQSTDDGRALKAARVALYQRGVTTSSSPTIRAASDGWNGPSC